jgi:hypothetical protein
MKLKKKQEEAFDRAIAILKNAGFEVSEYPEWDIKSEYLSSYGSYVPMIINRYFLGFEICARRIVRIINNIKSRVGKLGRSRKAHDLEIGGSNPPSANRRIKMGNYKYWLWWNRLTEEEQEKIITKVYEMQEQNIWSD